MDRAESYPDVIREMATEKNDEVTQPVNAIYIMTQIKKRRNYCQS